MSNDYLAYATGLILTFLISFFLALYTLKKREIKLHTFFVLVMFSICIWSFGSLMEFLSTDISTKILWSKICYIGITTVSPFLFLFVLSYGKYEKYLKNVYIVLLMIIPAIITFLAFSNELHHLIWVDIIPLSTSFGNLLIYKHGMGVWVNLAYSYFLLLIEMILMVEMFINSPKLYKLQAAAVLVGISFPLIFNIFYLTNISPVLVDLTPIAFAITSLCAALGIFRFHLLNILPVAHNKIFNTMTNGFLVFNSNEKLLEINLKAEKMFKLTSNNIGDTFSNIFGKWENLMSFYHSSPEKNNCELLIDGKWFNIQKTPLYYHEKAIYGYLLIITDINKHKLIEEELKKSLQEKNVLLQEIHHRVKNNMQIISSLLNLQSVYVDDQDTLNNLKESQERIKAMALVHEKLYQSDNIVKINFADYINSLVNELFNSYRVNKSLIKLNININDIFLDIDTAIPCGLIINEIISNIFKHAFIEGEEGTIYIKFFKKNNKYMLIIRDNGKGISPDINFNNTETLGLQLVNALVDQLKGIVKINRTNGTEFIIEFSP